jgi:hypothetical protein
MSRKMCSKASTLSIRSLATAARCMRALTPGGHLPRGGAALADLGLRPTSSSPGGLPLRQDLDLAGLLTLSQKC